MWHARPFCKHISGTNIRSQRTIKVKTAKRVEYVGSGIPSSAEQHLHSYRKAVNMYKSHGLHVGIKWLHTYTKIDKCRDVQISKNLPRATTKSEVPEG
jgi:hypothetical protein